MPQMHYVAEVLRHDWTSGALPSVGYTATIVSVVHGYVAEHEL